MYRYYFMAKNNIRKQKSDMITFFLLTFIASALIFISASFLMETGSVVDTAQFSENESASVPFYGRNREVGNVFVGDFQFVSYF